MKAIMLAAGVGRRLGGGDLSGPKALLKFAGETLLERHVGILRACGITELVVGVGHRADDLRAELNRIGTAGFARTIYNPHYQEGSIVTMWSLRDEFRSDKPVIMMDADVLYDERVMRRLVATAQANCFLMDRNVEPGDEPVKLALRNGSLVDFHKKLTRPHDFYGEWIGFVRLSASISHKVAHVADRIVSAGRREDMYEEVFRDLLFSEPPGTFGVEDITGLPWIEIDFVEDIAKARAEVLPLLQEAVRPR